MADKFRPSGNFAPFKVPQKYTVTCANCAKQFPSTFKPAEGRPIMCPECRENFVKENTKISSALQDCGYQIQRSIAQRQEKIHNNDTSGLASINAHIAYNLDVGRKKLQQFLTDLEGKIFSHSAIKRALENDSSEDIAYLHRYIPLFEEIVQSITPSLKQLFVQLNKADAYKSEAQVQELLKNIDEIIGKYHNEFRDIIRREFSTSLTIVNVDEKGGFSRIILLFYAVAAFDLAVDNIIQSNS